MYGNEYLPFLVPEWINTCRKLCLSVSKSNKYDRWFPPFSNVVVFFPVYPLSSLGMDRQVYTFRYTGADCPCRFCPCLYAQCEWLVRKEKGRTVRVQISPSGPCVMLLFKGKRALQFASDCLVRLYGFAHVRVTQSSAMCLWWRAQRSWRGRFAWYTNIDPVSTVCVCVSC